MKATNRYIRKTAARLLLGVLAPAAALASCVYEDLEPCPVDVRFVYDYNMQFADGFPRRVADVQLYIFGQDGQLLDTRRATAPAGGFGETYRMDLGDLRPGTYTLVAWATDDAPAAASAFDIAQEPAALTDLSVGIDPADPARCDLRLPSLWHGLTSEFTITGQAPEQAIVRLVQDVKRFRVMLQTADGRRLDPADYAFGITADNARLGHDNTVIPSGEKLCYTPYLLEEATVDNGDGTPLSALVCELNTLRLDAAAPARFGVRNVAEGRQLFDLDLIRYLELMRLDQYANMPLQEYLDREDTWNVVFVLDRQEHLLSIQINQWIMVFNETEL